MRAAAFQSERRTAAASCSITPRIATRSSSPNAMMRILTAIRADLLLPPRSLVDLVVVNLAFFASRRHRHPYAFAGVGAACGTVPTLFIGVDHVAQFAMDHSDAGDQRTDIAVNIDPELHHIGVPVAPVGGGRQLREVHSDVQVGGGMAVIQEPLTRALRIPILCNIEERHVE